MSDARSDDFGERVARLSVHFRMPPYAVPEQVQVSRGQDIFSPNISKIASHLRIIQLLPLQAPSSIEMRRGTFLKSSITAMSSS